LYNWIFVKFIFHLHLVFGDRLSAPLGAGDRPFRIVFAFFEVMGEKVELHDHVAPVALIVAADVQSKEDKTKDINEQI
jgi:hypothetical protein